MECKVLTYYFGYLLQSAVQVQMGVLSVGDA